MHERMTLIKTDLVFFSLIEWYTLCLHKKVPLIGGHGADMSARVCHFLCDGVFVDGDDDMCLIPDLSMLSMQPKSMTQE
jgi:hypothetical protein